MRVLIISENDSGQRLDRFLTKAFPTLSQGIIRSALRKNRIKVNNKRPDADYRLEKGDELKLYMDELISENSEKNNYMSLSKIPRELNILYEDKNLLILDKPIGLIVHEDNENSRDTLINRVLLYLEDKGEYCPSNPENDLSFRPSLCNRLDRNTGGIVIAAKNAESLRIISQKLKEREVTKLYLCIAKGIPGEESEPQTADAKKINCKPKNYLKNFDFKPNTCAFTLLTAYLEKFPDENMVKIKRKKTPNSKTIKTAYRVLDINRNKNMSILEINLLTGRTHQIRAHLAFIGHPLIGDGKYGKPGRKESKTFPRQALYSYKLRFDFKSDAGILEYLKGQEFEVDSSEIWFFKKYFI